MRYVNANLTWALPATFAVAVIWGVSALANYYFGASLGTDKPFDALIFTTTTSQIFSNASLASDVLKCVMLFAFTAAVSKKMWRPAAVTGCILVMCTAWSVASAVGFVAINHGTATDTRGKSVEEWTQLKAQIENLTERRAQIAAARPEGVVQAEIQALLRTPGADNCLVLNGPVTREICPQVDKLRIELETAKSAAWLDGRLDELRQQVGLADRVTSENPFAEMVSGLFGVVASKITTGQALWFALLLEMISGPGLWAIWSAVPKSRQEAPGAAKPSEATETPAKSLPPVQRPRTDALTKIAGVSAGGGLFGTLAPEQQEAIKAADLPGGILLGASPEIGPNSPNSKPDGRKDIGQTEPIAAEMSDKSAPTLHNSVDGTDFDGPGGRKPAPKVEKSPGASNVVDHPAKKLLTPDHPTKAELRIEKTPKRANETSVTRWVRDWTQPGDDDTKGRPAKDFFPDYLAYCKAKRERPVTPRKFSTLLAGELNMPKLRRADGTRKAAQQLFKLKLVNDDAKRRVA